jgi:hypothetical protein
MEAGMSLIARVSLLGALIGGSMTAFARADDKAACIAANELGQKLDDEHKLLDARTQFLACARDSCPPALRTDCFEQLSKLETRIPSIVVRARDPKGNDLSAVRLSIDGASAAESLDGKAIEIDPGVHVLRLEAAGQDAVEQKLVIGEGERARVVVVTIGGSVSPTPPPPAASPHAAWIVGALGVVSLGTGIVFYAVGYHERSSDLSDGCATQDICDSQKSSVRTKLIVGDVLAGVGIAALVTSAILFVSGSSDESTTTSHAPRLDATFGARGGVATFSFTF